MTVLNVDAVCEFLCKYYDSNTVRLLAEEHPQQLLKLYHDVMPHETTIDELLSYRGRLLVDSPDGFVPVKSVIKKKQHEILNVRFSNGKNIKTSPFHMFESPLGVFLATVNLKPGVKVLSENGIVEVAEVTDLGYTEDVYDLAVEHEKHRYYTDGISSHNSGSGKSLFLQNISINWVELGLNVVYITLELSENLCAMRLDAMVAGVETREILKKVDDVAILVKQYGNKYRGTIRLKQLPNGCTVNDIRSFVKETEVQTGKKIDAIVVDYLDLMMPVSVKVSPSDQFIKDKYVSEELRNLATELNTLMVTASQLNRSSYEEVEFNPANIAGGISKVNTADNVIGIFTSMAMRESGRYQLQFIKTRSSSGVGSKVDLAFCPKTLRITDLEDGQDGAVMSATSSILSNLRKKSSVVDSSEKKDDVKPAASESTKPVEVKSAAVNLRDLLRKQLD